MKTSLEITINDAQEALDRCQPEEALKLITNALNLNPKNPVLLELAGTVYVELMNCSLAGTFTLMDFDTIGERALNFFKESVSIAPDLGYSKYLYLGQLTCGTESVVYYEKGMEILSSLVEDADDEGMKIIYQKKLSQTCCSLVEIYMTDCCEEPDAEQKCEKFIKSALNYDSKSSEVYSTLASLELTQQKLEQARESLGRAVDLWINIDPSDMNYPVYSVRMVQAKLLIECGVYEKALDVLVTLQRENDQDAEMWYVFGWCYFLQAGGTDDPAGMPKDMTANQLRSFEDAKACLETVFQVIYIFMKPKTPVESEATS